MRTVRWIALALVLSVPGVASLAEEAPAPETGAALCRLDASLVPTGPGAAPIALDTQSVTCRSTCRDGRTTTASCTETLEICCSASRRLACLPFGGFVSGYCTDGTNTLTC